jgi:hypothetical protein
VRHCENPRRATLFLALAVLLTACGLPGGSPGAPSAIDCQVFYRSSTAGRFSETDVTLSATANRESVTFEDLAFNAQYTDDIGEGQSLALSVVDLETGQETARQLYQLDRQRGLVNQFVGGHGFTGLIYVYHPTSQAEMQYFCATH